LLTLRVLSAGLALSACHQTRAARSAMTTRLADAAVASDAGPLAMPPAADGGMRLDAGRPPPPAAGYALEARPDSSFGASSIAIGDVTGDGRADLIAANGKLLLAAQTADGQLAPARALAVAAAESVLLVDLDADGLLDIVASNPNGLESLLARGAGSFASALATSGPALRELGSAADVDGDGRSDVLSIAAGSEPAVVAYLGDGQGGFAAQRTPLAADGGEVAAFAAADLDGDGSLELVVFRRASGTVEVYTHDAALGFGLEPVRYVIGNQSSASVRLVIADLDDDGRSDILLAASDGLPGIAVLGQTSSGSFERRGAVATGNGVGAFAIADLDRDGRSDVIAVFPDQALLSVFERAPGSYRALAQARMSISALQASLAVGDLDADGCLDLAIARLSSTSLFYGANCRQ
jgi:adhesin/invasin